MTEQSLYTYKKTLKDKNHCVVYNLIFKDALYCLESYKEDQDEQMKKYCYIENLTDDEGEAETFLKMLAKDNVSPIHVKEIAEDYFGK